MRRQRAALAALLPIAPTAGLKGTVLSSVLGGGAAAAGAGTAASVAGLGAAKGLAAKSLLCALVAGSAGSAGYVAVHDLDAPHRRDVAQAGVTRHRAHKPRKAAPHASRAARPPVVARVATTVPIAATAPKPAPARAAGAQREARHRHRTGFAHWRTWAAKRQAHAPFAKGQRPARSRRAGRRGREVRRSGFARTLPRRREGRAQGGHERGRRGGRATAAHRQRVPSGGDQPAGVPWRR